MGDIGRDGKEVEKKAGEAVPPTSVKTTKKETAPPVSQTQSGFQYTRGNFDTSVITLLATINANIVKQTEILKKAIEDGRSTK
jgi:hypothetical protein